MTQVSGVMVTNNHAHHMVDAINSLYLICEDIVVVDQGSTDGTVEMAKAMGCTVVRQDFPVDEMGNFTFALDKCKHPWIFAMYPHERVDEDLATLIRAEDLDELNLNVIGIARKIMLGQRLLRFGGFYPSHADRLFNREKVMLSDFTKNVDGTDVSYGFVEAHLTCYQYEDYPDFFRQMMDVTDEVDELRMKLKSPKMWQTWLYSIGQFWWTYIFRLSFLMGMDGLTVAVARAVRKYLVLSRLIEMRDGLEWSRQKR